VGADELLGTVEESEIMLDLRQVEHDVPAKGPAVMVVSGLQAREIEEAPGKGEAIMLVEFTHADSNDPVWVNPDYVVTVVSQAEVPDVTILRLVDGEQFGVKGKAKEVVNKLGK
jgi:uncharacterized protein YlzI (FlbEa/FlbD family)